MLNRFGSVDNVLQNKFCVIQKDSKKKQYVFRFYFEMLGGDLSERRIQSILKRLSFNDRV